MTDDEVRIEYMPLSALKAWPRNPKEHDLGLLHTSMDRFGFVNPIIINESTGVILAGHGRLDTLAQKQKDGQPLPERCKEGAEGEWLVPVIRGIELPEREAEAYAISDNRSTESGGWDEALLTKVLQGIVQETEGLIGVGYNEDDLDALLAFTSFDGVGPLPDVDLEWLVPETSWRLIIRCSDKEEFLTLKRRLGLPEDDAITVNYVDVKVGE